MPATPDVPATPDASGLPAMPRPPDRPDGAPLRLVVLTDLDDTLFQTARKLPAADATRSTLAARASNGHDSFATPRQLALLDWMDPARCIPVTARGTEAYSRVALPFAGPAAIVANGAVILDADGCVNTDWQTRVQAALAPLRPLLDGLPERLLAEADRHGLSIRTWLVQEPGCDGVYAVAKCNDDPSGAPLRLLVPALLEHLGIEDGVADPGDEGTRWRMHLNGNNLALIPPGVSKALATVWLLERLRRDGELLAIGVGDSSSDLAFMRACDLWMTPSGSQLDRAWGGPPA